MNTNPSAKRILCYGDSNTWGQKPGHTTSARYTSDIRWTGVLQNLLGEGYEIIEQGLPGRTLNCGDLPVNGHTALPVILGSQQPLDLVIVWLGTNDLRYRYNHTGQELAVSLDNLLKSLRQQLGDSTQVLLICPPLILEDRAGSDFNGVTGKLEVLPTAYQLTADKHSTGYLDLTHLIMPDLQDGVHLSPESHRIVGESIYAEVIELID